MNIIILKKGYDLEAWSSLKVLCEEKKYKYNTLRKRKFPFYYDGIYFEKIPINKQNKYFKIK